MLVFALTVHRYLRFVILAFGVLGVLRSLVSLNTREPKFMRIDEVMSRAFSGALDLQTLAGIVLILLLPGEGRSIAWLHPILTLPAVVAAHLGRRFRDRPDRDRLTAQLILYVASLALIALGLAVIGQLRLM